VRVRNTGATPITSITFGYGVKDSTVYTYTWTGNLAPSQTTDIAFDNCQTLTNMSLDSITGVYNFKVNIQQVNGLTDGDATNNQFNSTFVAAPLWPTQIVVTMKTNNAGTNGLGSGSSETSWKITDMYGNIYAQRSNCALSTTYIDTVSFALNGFYRLLITDGGCDGLWWWPYQGSSVTAGDFSVKKLGSTIKIPMNGYTYTGTYRHDFGCEFSQYFTTVSNPTGVITLSPSQKSGAEIEVYPNPSSDMISIQISDNETISGRLELIDATGNVVSSASVSTFQSQMDVSKLSNGIYTLTYKNQRSQVVQKRISVIR
jgi:hypothetical protein